MQNNKQIFLILCILWVLIIIASRWIIPVDMRPITQDYLADVAKSHQLGEQPVHFGLLGWVFTVTAGLWVIRGIAKIREMLNRR